MLMTLAFNLLLIQVDAAASRDHFSPSDGLHFSPHDKSVQLSWQW